MFNLELMNKPATVEGLNGDLPRTKRYFNSYGLEMDFNISNIKPSSGDKVVVEIELVSYLNPLYHTIEKKKKNRRIELGFV